MDIEGRFRATGTSGGRVPDAILITTFHHGDRAELRNTDETMFDELGDGFTTKSLDDSRDLEKKLEQPTVWVVEVLPKAMQCDEYSPSLYPPSPNR